MLLPDPTAIAAGLILIGVMAVTARLMKMGERTRAALIAPQQIVLLIQLMGVGVAAWNGAYPDGYVPVPDNWWAWDQAALIVTRDWGVDAGQRSRRSWGLVGSFPSTLLVESPRSFSRIYNASPSFP